MPSHLINGFTSEYDQITNFGQDIVCIFDEVVCNNFGIATLNLYQGNTKIINCVVEDKNNKLVDITNCKIWFTVKDYNYLNIDNDAYALIQKRNFLAGGSDVEIIVIDAIAGQFRIIISSNDSKILDFDSYEWDIQLGFSDGSIYTIARGKFNILSKTTNTY